MAVKSIILQFIDLDYILGAVLKLEFIWMKMYKCKCTKPVNYYMSPEHALKSLIGIVMLV